MTRGNKHDGRGAAQVRALSGHMDDWEDLAVDYMDGQVDGETRAAIESHLQDCPACAARLHVQQQVFTLLKETPLDDPPPELENRVLGELSFSPAPAIRAVARPRTEEPSRGWSTLVPQDRTLGARHGRDSGGALRSRDLWDAQFGCQRLRRRRRPLPIQSAEKTADDNGLQEAAPTYSGADTTAAAAAGTTATTAAGTETTMAPVVGMTAGAGATETTYAPYTDATAKAFDGLAQDEMTMAADLEAAEVARLLRVRGSGSRPSEDSAETTAAFVAQITLLTGIGTLGRAPSRSTGRLSLPTSLETTRQQFVDLLRSVGASLGLTVSLDTQPPDEIAEGHGASAGTKGGLPRTLQSPDVGGGRLEPILHLTS